MLKKNKIICFRLHTSNILGIFLPYTLESQENKRKNLSAVEQSKTIEKNLLCSFLQRMCTNISSTGSMTKIPYLHQEDSGVDLFINNKGLSEDIPGTLKSFRVNLLETP